MEPVVDVECKFGNTKEKREITMIIEKYHAKSTRRYITEKKRNCQSRCKL